MKPPHPEFMQRALAEAERARGRTRPNPMVGCLIAHGDTVVAMGHHQKAGQAHAELIALRRAGARARGADVYVTLEPCSHFGRTAPCVDALIRAGVGRVFVGARDPNPLVNGRGLRKLRAAGIPVEVGLLGKACRRLNEAFEFSMRHQRPWVVAKLAQSLDGRVATRSGESQWITSPIARRHGHALRNTLDTILVGAATVHADNPRLTCRIRGGRDPVRVVLDTHANVSPRAQVVQVACASTAPTWICVGHKASARRRQALERAGAHTLPCKVTRQGRLDLRDVLAHIHARQALSVLVEGGPTVLGGFFDAHLVNRVYAFVAPLIIGGDGARSSVGAQGIATLARACRLAHIETSQLGPDWLICGEVVR